MAREGLRGRRRWKGETGRWCKFSQLQSHHIRHICPKRQPFSVEWVTKQYFPWFKAGLMWRRFKSNHLGPVLAGESKKWVEMSFPFRIQFLSTPRIDKIPETQKSATLEVSYIFQGYKAWHKKLFSQLCQIPGGWFILKLTGLLFLLFPSSVQSLLKHFKIRDVL